MQVENDFSIFKNTARFHFYSYFLKQQKPLPIGKGLHTFFCILFFTSQVSSFQSLDKLSLGLEALDVNLALFAKLLQLGKCHLRVVNIPFLLDSCWDLFLRLLRVELLV